MTGSLGSARPLVIGTTLWLLAIGAVPLLRLLAEATGHGAVAAAIVDPAVWHAAGNSLRVSLGAAALATLIGGGLARALLLRGMPGRGALLFCAVLPALVPAQVMALGWIQAFGPASPLLLALDLAPPIGTPNPVYGPAGITILLAVQAAPLVLLSVAAVLAVPMLALLAAALVPALGMELTSATLTWRHFAAALAPGAHTAAAFGNSLLLSLGAALLLALAALPVALALRARGAGGECGDRPAPCAARRLHRGRRHPGGAVAAGRRRGYARWRRRRRHAERRRRLQPAEWRHCRRYRHRRRRQRPGAGRRRCGCAGGRR